MTIYALSTGPGISGVAIIRISGEQSSKIIETLTGKKVPQPKSSNIKKNQ
jgi:tRNA modification GTPase